MASKSLEKAKSKSTKIRNLPKTRSAAKSKIKTSAQIDRMIWNQIQDDFILEFENTKHSPELVKKALKCIQNENVKKVLTEYILSLESYKIDSRRHRDLFTDFLKN